MHTHACHSEMSFPLSLWSISIAHLVRNPKHIIIYRRIVGFCTRWVIFAKPSFQMGFTWFQMGAMFTPQALFKVSLTTNQAFFFSTEYSELFLHTNVKSNVFNVSPETNYSMIQDRCPQLKYPQIILICTCFIIPSSTDWENTEIDEL